MFKYFLAYHVERTDDKSFYDNVVLDLPYKIENVNTIRKAENDIRLYNCDWFQLIYRITIINFQLL